MTVLFLSQNKTVTRFGSQIRNYFLRPDQRVKDSRTGFQIGISTPFLEANSKGFWRHF